MYMPVEIYHQQFRIIQLSCAYLCLSAYKCMFVCACMPCVCMCAYLCVCVCVCVYVCVCVCVCWDDVHCTGDPRRFLAQGYIG